MIFSPNDSQILMLKRVISGLNNVACKEVLFSCSDKHVDVFGCDPASHCLVKTRFFSNKMKSYVQDGDHMFVLDTTDLDVAVGKIKPKSEITIKEDEDSFTMLIETRNTRKSISMKKLDDTVSKKYINGYKALNELLENHGFSVKLLINHELIKEIIHDINGISDWCDVEMKTPDELIISSDCNYSEIEVTMESDSEMIHDVVFNERFKARFSIKAFTDCFVFVSGSEMTEIHVKAGAMPITFVSKGDGYLAKIFAPPCLDDEDEEDEEDEEIAEIASAM